jgi:hypothetical protein
MSACVPFKECDSCDSTAHQRDWPHTSAAEIPLAALFFKSRQLLVLPSPILGRSLSTILQQAARD